MAKREPTEQEVQLIGELITYRWRNRSVKKVTKGRKKKAKEAALNAPNWVRHVAATKGMKRRRLAGTFGAASPVRVLVKDGKPVKE